MLKILSYSSDLLDLGVLSSADFEDEQTSILNYQKAYCDFLKLYAEVNRIKVPFSDEAFQEYKQDYKYNKVINKNSYYIREFSKISDDPVHDELEAISNYFCYFYVGDNQAEMYKFMTQCLNEKFEQLYSEINLKINSSKNTRPKKPNDKRCNHIGLNQDSYSCTVNAKKRKNESLTQDKFELTEDMIAFVLEHSGKRLAKIESLLKNKFKIDLKIKLRASIKALLTVCK